MSGVQLFGKNPFRWLIGSIREFGIGQTLAIMWSVVLDARFDARYGTDTARRIPKEQIATSSENIVHCVNYGATKSGPFALLMRRLHLPRDLVFVDLGSGKGKALMLATRYGFRKVVGLEFSGDLCAIARENLQKYLRIHPSASQVEVIETDVTRYHMRDDEAVFFMLDPFNAPVLREVLANIRASVRRRPRTVWLIYSVPREQHVIDEAGLFTNSKRYVLLGAEFKVYTNAAATPV